MGIGAEVGSLTIDEVKVVEEGCGGKGGIEVSLESARLEQLARDTRQIDADYRK